MSPDPVHIVLIGLMGTGKSTVGYQLAKKLDIAFVDTDDKVCQLAQTTVREIFSSQGEEVFRDLEQVVLEQALQSPLSSIIAAAGGCVLRQKNREALATADAVIWLDASVDTLVKRLGARAKTADGHRPLIDGDPSQRLSTLRAERLDLYQSACTARVAVDALTMLQVVDLIGEMISGTVKK